MLISYYRMFITRCTISSTFYDILWNNCSIGFCKENGKKKYQISSMVIFHKLRFKVLQSRNILVRKKSCSDVWMENVKTRRQSVLMKLYVVRLSFSLLRNIWVVGWSQVLQKVGKFEIISKRSPPAMTGN